LSLTLHNTHTVTPIIEESSQVVVIPLSVKLVFSLKHKFYFAFTLGTGYGTIKTVTVDCRLRFIFAFQGYLF